MPAIPLVGFPEITPGNVEHDHSVEERRQFRLEFRTMVRPLIVPRHDVQGPTFCVLELSALCNEVLFRREYA